MKWRHHDKMQRPLRRSSPPTTTIRTKRQRAVQAIFDLPGAWCTRLRNHFLEASDVTHACTTDKVQEQGAAMRRLGIFMYLHVKTPVCFETRVRESSLTKFLALANGAKSREINFDRLHAIITQSLELAKDRRCAIHRPPTAFFSPSVLVLHSRYPKPQCGCSKGRGLGRLRTVLRRMSDPRF